MACQSQFQSRQELSALFAHRGDGATKAAEVLRSRQATEAAGDFLLHFDHTDIALGLTIVKRHTEILQEPQNGVLVVVQAMQEIASGALFWSAPLGRACDGRRVGGIGLPAFLQDGLILPVPVGYLGWGQLPQPLCLLHCFLHREQERTQIARPGLSLLLLKEEQLTQMMHVAERMVTKKLPVRCPAVMHHHACIGGEQTNGNKRLASPFGMHSVVRQGGRDRGMLPEPLAHHVQTRLVHMQHPGCFPMPA